MPPAASPHLPHPVARRRRAAKLVLPAQTGAAGSLGVAVPATAVAIGTEDARFAAAHAALRADATIQRSLPPALPDPPPPGWVLAVRHALEWLGDTLGAALGWLFGWLPPLPWARILLWGLVATLAALFLWMLVERLRTGAWRLPRLPSRRTGAPDAGLEPDDAWVPEAAPARALLADADRLAAEGRFDEAVHLLLQRSVEDIGRRRPGTLRPALTSRDIAGLPAVPPAARRFFATIAEAVERSLFGGRAAGADAWNACRQAYAEFALPKAWA